MDKEQKTINIIMQKYFIFINILLWNISLPSNLFSAQDTSCSTKEIIGDSARIKLKTEELAQQMFTFNFVNYKEKIAAASSSLSENSASVYEHFLEKTGLLNTVKSQKLIQVPIGRHYPKLKAHHFSGLAQSFELETPLHLRLLSPNSASDFYLSVLFHVESKKPFNTVDYRLVDIKQKKYLENDTANTTSYLKHIKTLTCDLSGSLTEPKISDKTALIVVKYLLDEKTKDQEYLKKLIREYYGPGNEYVHSSTDLDALAFINKGILHQKFSWLFTAPIEISFNKNNSTHKKLIKLRLQLSRSNTKNSLLGVDLSEVKIFDDKIEQKTAVKDLIDYDTAKNIIIAPSNQSPLLSKIRLLNIPIDNPGVNDTEIKIFAQEAIKNSFTYSFKTMDTNLANLNSYFTTSGWKSFINALNASGRLNAMVNSKSVVSAKILQKPEIIKQGLHNKNYVWMLQVPVKLFYYSKNHLIIEECLINLSIKRTLKSNTIGLGIYQFILGPWISLE